mmetsp:Transcript_56607/g.131970  ORF Transcript_56607/g.131970 Transcript_56607/m.131970 type:complete len:405 (-) Transcript_56607:24-1238(-)
MRKHQVDHPSGPANAGHEGKPWERREATQVELQGKVAVVVARPADPMLLLKSGLICVHLVAFELQGHGVTHDCLHKIHVVVVMWFRSTMPVMATVVRGSSRQAPLALKEGQTLFVWDRHAHAVRLDQRMFHFLVRPQVDQSLPPLQQAQVLQVTQFHQLLLRACKLDLKRCVRIAERRQVGDWVLRVWPLDHLERVTFRHRPRAQDPAQESCPPIGGTPMPHGALCARALDGRNGWVPVVDTETAKTRARDLYLQWTVGAFQNVTEADAVGVDTIHEELLSKGRGLVLPVVPHAGELDPQVFVVLLASHQHGTVPRFTVHELLVVITVPFLAVFQAHRIHGFALARALSNKMYRLLLHVGKWMPLPDTENFALRKNLLLHWSRHSARHWQISHPTNFVLWTKLA